MTLEIIFVLSGLVVVAIIWAKIAEDKRRAKPAILKLISRGDERTRLLTHELTHKYFAFKEGADFFLNKELPFRTKNFIQKTNSVVKERIEKHVGDIRGSKFLKKSDGISEFFKSLSEKENGRIDQELSDIGSQEDETEVE